MNSDISDMLNDWRSHLIERVTNPILAPFTLAWIAWNWRALAVLILSTETIETRIEVIQNTYLNWCYSLIYPLLFAGAFAVGMPWLTLVIQHIQNGAIKRRKLLNLNDDTEFLRQSVSNATAQAELSRILAQDEITRNQKEELEEAKTRLSEEQNAIRQALARDRKELEAKQLQYEELRDKTSVESNAKKAELERLSARLAEEKALTQRRLTEMEGVLALKEANLRKTLANSPLGGIVSDDIVFDALRSLVFRLVYNPDPHSRQSKLITFIADSTGGYSGTVGEGRNQNEHSWRIFNGQLELVQVDSQIHSRFIYFAASHIFLNTNDKDTKSIRGQYMIPEDVKVEFRK